MSVGQSIGRCHTCPANPPRAATGPQKELCLSANSRRGVCAPPIMGCVAYGRPPSLQERPVTAALSSECSLLANSWDLCSMHPWAVGGRGSEAAALSQQLRVQRHAQRVQRRPVLLHLLKLWGHADVAVVLRGGTHHAGMAVHRQRRHAATEDVTCAAREAGTECTPWQLGR